MDSEPAHPASGTLLDKFHHVDIGGECQYRSSILERDVSHEARIIQ